MSAVYAPLSDSVAGQALACIARRLHDQPAGAWIPNTVICRDLGIKANVLGPSMQPAVAQRAVERGATSQGHIQWRLPMRKARRASAASKTPPRFGIDWPPGFVSQFDSIRVASYDERRK